MGTNTVNKFSQVMMWLGFGISLVLLFVLVWRINAAFFSYIASPHPAQPVVFLNNEMGSIVCAILVILGLAFSIAGLLSAKKNSLKKLPRVLVILVLCVSLIGVCAPIIYVELFIKTEPLELSIPSTTKEIRDGDVKLDNTGRLGDVKCSKSDGSSMTNMNAKSVSQFSEELKTWLQANDYNEDDFIVIKVDEDVSYAICVNVLDALKELGIKHYEIEE